ncbi:FAD-dependent oxidoreductase [Pseudomonas tussilaginis]|uniref:dihydrolipoyl dehydrogenase family protein n=1 Tax=unclassified Pseudomonas TaxID=196821 RepID=UPI0013044310|nr:MULTISPECIES: FAD-dependent oxidoreductase [unclassified Pseudomonas]QYX49979.1 FAD-dependent oxidoreductase [Pseudomonas sp. S11A 273]
MQKYDLAIIGAGAGGLNAALSAAAVGKRVILIEKHNPGGECTWAGCIPSKALIQIAKDVKVAQRFGHVSVDSAAIMGKVRALIEQAHQAETVPLLESAGIEYLCGTAQFTGLHTLDVDGQTVHAEHIVIATGSSPIVPDICGLDTVSYLTNENVFQLESLPKSLIILGAGAIGVELSQAMQRLGVKVKLVDRAASVLPREEHEFAAAVQQLLTEEGVEVYTNCAVEHVQQHGSEVILTVTHGEQTDEIRGEALLLALGRKPNTATINLNVIGVDYDGKGIKVNEFCETTAQRTYAVGDVVGPYLFSHTAGYQARGLIRNLFGSGKKKPIDLGGVAWCTFTEPELAHCGLMEADARLMYGDNITVFVTQYSELDRAVVDQKTVGMAKVICDAKGEILGASILGERACELLGELQVMKQQRIPFQKLQEVIHPYPGYSEILLYMSLDAYGHYNNV